MVQPKIRSFVSVLRFSVTPFDRGKKIAKSENFLKIQRLNSAPFTRGEIEVQIFGKEKCKILRQFQRFGKEECKLLHQFQRY